MIVNKRLNHTEILEYHQWLSDNPLIPPGLTSIDAFQIHKQQGLQRKLQEYEGENL